MIPKHSRTITIWLCLGLVFLANLSLAGNGPMPSWNESAGKKAIIAYVEAITDRSGNAFVEPGGRIAVFDNDGTLWSEKPFYFQLFFAMDRVKKLSPDHPEWKTQQPFQAVLEGDLETLVESGEHGLIELVMATHGGMTTTEFADVVKEWLKTARHPTLNKPYTELVYKPMLELLDYLRANDFKTFIVSGGGIEFMRPWVEEVYGIPPEQVIGSSIVTKYEIRGGKPVLIREPKINYIDDKEGKPVAINQHIGRRPIFAFGNSDGDLQMLQWTTLAGAGKRFAGIVHHTDAEREFAYDRESQVGRLDRALVEGEKNGWIVVDMKRDWRRIYPE